MSMIPVHPLWRGSCRILMLSTAVMAVAAGAVLAVGTQDARLLRLGLIAALWAALLGAFAAAQMRREASSCADHSDQLRSTYQLELEREVSARREHALIVERELREQAECAQRSEMVELRAEIAAMRASLELLGGASMVERVTLCAESTRVLPLVAPPRTLDDSRPAAQAVAGRRGRSDPAFRFGPDPQTSTAAAALPAVDTGISRGQSRHGALVWPSAQSPRAQSQRTVEDLIAAHGAATAAPRRRSHQDDAATTA